MSRDEQGELGEPNVDSDVDSEAAGTNVGNGGCGCGREGVRDGEGVSPEPEQPVGEQCPATQDESIESKGKGKGHETDSVEASPSTGNKRSRDFSSPRTRLTMAQKVEVLQLLNNRVRHDEISRKFKISKRTVSSIAHNRQTLEKKAKSFGYNSEAKASRPAAFPKVEEAVAIMTEEAKRCNLTVTTEVIKCFARSVKDDMLAADSISAEERSKLEGFTASHNWVTSFLKRRGFTGEALHGDGEASTFDEEASVQAMHDLRDACIGYELSHIFNLDETSMFYKMLPRRSYSAAFEKRKASGDVKDSKVMDRISIYLCTNASGSVKVPISVIGKGEDSCVLKHKNLPVRYFSQENGWSDCTTMLSWWQTVFLPFIRDYTVRPVLMLMDSRTYFAGVVDPRGQVTVRLYPPKFTSKHQPMNNGVIATTRLHFRRRLLVKRARNFCTPRISCEEPSCDQPRGMSAGTRGLAEGGDPHLHDVCEILGEAWNDITQTTIARCWVRAYTLPKRLQDMLTKAFSFPVPEFDMEREMERLKRTLDEMSLDAMRTLEELAESSATAGTTGSGENAAAAAAAAAAAVASAAAAAAAVAAAAAAVGSYDTLEEVEKLYSTLAASGVADADLCEMLSDLNIVPGQAASRAAVTTAFEWATLEENRAIAEILERERQDLILEQILRKKPVVSGKENSEDGKGVQATVVDGCMANDKAYENLLLSLGQLEDRARDGGNPDVVSRLQRARVLITAARLAEQSSQTRT